MERPQDWIEFVNAPALNDLDRIRSEADRSVAQMGIVMAKQLGLESTMKSRGRPKRAGKDSGPFPHSTCALDSKIKDLTLRMLPVKGLMSELRGCNASERCAAALKMCWKSVVEPVKYRRRQYELFQTG